MATTKTITMNEDKITQLIFPAPIKSFKGGFIPSDFAISTEDNVLYIQPMGDFSESNMNIITTDGCYYTFSIQYNVGASSFNYIFTTDDAIFKDGSSTPAGVKEDSASVTSADSDLDVACKKILQQNGYLLTRNSVKVKNFSMTLKGIYIDSNHIYFRLLFNNDGNIGYDIDFIAFYVEAVLKGKASTQEKVQLQPLHIYNNTELIRPKSEYELVICFEKFTIGTEKALFINSVEKGGERNLNLEVHNKMILEARNYE